MKSKYIIMLITLLGKMLLSILICIYFFSSKTIDAIIHIPVLIFIYCIVFVLLQLFTRWYFSKENWWDWVYYVGLLTFMISASIGSTSLEKFYLTLTKTGALLLILSVIIDGTMFIKQITTT